MRKVIAVLAGEPNSISSEIIFKTWKKRKKFKLKPFFVIGNLKLLNKQRKILKFNIKLKNINKNFKISELLGEHIPVLDINYFQPKAFQPISSHSNKYIFQCFKCAIKIIQDRELLGLITCPISKESLLRNKYNGITEYLSKKTNSRNNEVMLIYNSLFSVSPITTHIPIRQVSNKLHISNIVKKIIIINQFYKKKFKLNPKIGILGLNPHNFSTNKKFSEENRIIIPSINFLKLKKIKIAGPIPPDTIFLAQKKLNLNIIVGMYHDQVLAPFKAIHGFKAINVTIGLPFIRTSPDHGVAQDIMGKKIADPTSLIEAFQFFNKIKCF